MQMTITEQCPFYLPTAIFIRTKAKVRVSPKGWRTVFGRFTECKDKHYSRNLQTFNSLLLSLFVIHHDIVCKARAKGERRNDRV